MSANTLRSSALVLCYSAAEYCAPVWSRSAHTSRVDVQLNSTMRLISGTLRSTPLPWPHNPATRFRPPSATVVCWTVFARNRRCLTLLNPVPWQNWMAAYLGYTLRMRTLFRGWPIMVNDTHTRRRRLHSTPSITWRIYYWLGVFNILKLSRNS